MPLPTPRLAPYLRYAQPYSYIGTPPPNLRTELHLGRKEKLRQLYGWNPQRSERVCRGCYRDL
eukprot:1427437-Prymnesium_polylepis.1